MSNQHIKNLIRHLDNFQNEPKVIDGFKIKKWFNCGEYLFEEFHELGNSVGWQYSAVRSHPQIEEVITGVTRNQQWLRTFLSLYPALRLDLDGGYPARFVCRVRSGLECLLRGFENIDSNFNIVLKNLAAEGNLEEFDRQLKIWSDNGYRPSFFEGDLYPGTPTSHWWWY